MATHTVAEQVSSLLGGDPVTDLELIPEPWSGYGESRSTLAPCSARQPALRQVPRGGGRSCGLVAVGVPRREGAAEAGLRQAYLALMKPWYERVKWILFQDGHARSSSSAGCAGAAVSVSRDHTCGLRTDELRLPRRPRWKDHLAGAIRI